MDAAAEQFPQFADLFSEPLLLLTSRGIVRAANQAAREQLFASGAALEQPLSTQPSTAAGHAHLPPQWRRRTLPLRRRCHGVA